MHSLICCNFSLLLYWRYRSRKLSIKCNKLYHTVWLCYNVHVITKNTIKFSSKWHKISSLNYFNLSQSVSLNIRSFLMILIILLRLMMTFVSSRNIKLWRLGREVYWPIWLLPLMDIYLLLLRSHWLRWGNILHINKRHKIKLKYGPVCYSLGDAVNNN